MIAFADLLSDPQRVDEVPQASIPALLAQCAAVQSALAARLVQAGDAAVPVGEPADEGDGWLTAGEAAALSTLGVRWLYRHWGAVPGAKKFSARRLRFQERTFRKWLEKRP